MFVSVSLCVLVCMSVANYMNVCIRGATRPPTCLQSGSDGAYSRPVPCHGQHVSPRLTRTVSGHSGHLLCDSHVQCLILSNCCFAVSLACRHLPGYMIWLHHKTSYEVTLVMLEASNMFGVVATMKGF